RRTDPAKKTRGRGERFCQERIIVSSPIQTRSRRIAIGAPSVERAKNAPPASTSARRRRLAGPFDSPGAGRDRLAAQSQSGSPSVPRKTTWPWEKRERMYPLPAKRAAASAEVRRLRRKSRASSHAPSAPSPRKRRQEILIAAAGSITRARI